jgi:hypothetical protein
MPLRASPEAWLPNIAISDDATEACSWSTSALLLLSARSLGVSKYWVYKSGALGKACTRSEDLYAPPKSRGPLIRRGVVLSDADLCKTAAILPIRPKGTSLLCGGI